MNKFFKTTLILLVLGGLGYLGYVGYNYYKDSTKPGNDVIINVDTIKDYDYSLDDRDTKVYKKYFNELKTVLATDTVDDENYALLVAKLYIIDLYTIDNKMSLYDVGGLDFVHPDIRDNYELKVKDTIYKYVEDNTNGDRKQSLPVVKDIIEENIVKTTYKLGDNESDAFQVKLTWEYENDLEYDTSATLILVKHQNKYYVVSQKE